MPTYLRRNHEIGSFNPLTVIILSGLLVAVVLVGGGYILNTGEIVPQARFFVLKLPRPTQIPPKYAEPSLSPPPLRVVDTPQNSPHEVTDTNGEKFTIQGFERFTISVPPSWAVIQDSAQMAFTVYKSQYSILFSYMPFGVRRCLYQWDQSYNELNKQHFTLVNAPLKFPRYIEIRSSTNIFRRGVPFGIEDGEDFITEVVCENDEIRDIFSEAGVAFITLRYPREYMPSILYQMDDILSTVSSTK